MLRKTLFTINEEEKATREGFGTALVSLSEKDERVMALCADLTESVKMDAFKGKFPKRFFEMGITEQAMSGVASGMAAMGKIPFMASYAMFSPGRNWEQIRTTICYNNVPVKIVGAHTGLSVGPDGATHQAIEDVGLMHMLPNMTVLAPCDAIEAYAMTMQMADIKGPVYIRLAREKSVMMLTDSYEYQHGKAYVMYTPKKEYAHTVGVLAYGPLIYEAIHAARVLEKEGIGVTVVNVPCIKPLDEKFIIRFAKEMRKIVTVEEHQIANGLGSIVAALLSTHMPTKMGMIGIKDRFGQSGRMKELYEEYELTSAHIQEKIKSVL